MPVRNVRVAHSEQLRNPVIAAEYLNHALLSEDPAIILKAISNIVHAHEKGVSYIAEKAELRRESVYKILLPTGNPKLSTLTALLHGLGLQMQVIPARAA